MDLLEELRRRVAQIDPHDHIAGIKAAIRHIERAEAFLTRGRAEHDPDSFNDVIYRTNQAFEGMLKEAYSVLENKDASRLSANEIEQHFLDTERFTGRVHGLFKSYRQQWRNPATHDHKLLFSEDEALLAIVNVSAFAVMLLDQIVEIISFRRQRAATARKREELTAKLQSQGLSFVREVVEYIKYFLEFEINLSRDSRGAAELIGSLSGFLVGLNLGLDVSVEGGGVDHGFDLVVARAQQSVAVEVKYGQAKADYLDAMIGQLRAYVSAAKANSGILVITPGTPLRMSSTKVVDNPSLELWLIRPEPKKGGSS